MSRARGRAGSTVPWFGLVALASFGGVAAALVSQHVYAMEPCPWCVLQRLIFVAIGAVALLALLWPARTVRGIAAAIALLLALSGLASALWQHFVAAASASCNLTLADRIVSGTGLDSLLPDVFAPRASCADAAVNLLGIPYAYWAAALFVLCALAMLRAIGRRD